MKEIPLTQGKFAIVDDADYEELSKYKWCALYSKDMSSFYAGRESRKKEGEICTIRMRRQILGLEYGDPRHGDHQNHNTLDNRRSNIRICTSRQNSMNRKPDQNTSSKYKGVSWENSRNKWQAHITIKGKKKHLGYFQTEELAALTYNEAAKKYFKEFAYLNVIV